MKNAKLFLILLLAFTGFSFAEDEDDSVVFDQVKPLEQECRQAAGRSKPQRSNHEKLEFFVKVGEGYKYYRSECMNIVCKHYRSHPEKSRNFGTSGVAKNRCRVKFLEDKNQLEGEPGTRDRMKFVRVQGRIFACEKNEPARNCAIRLKLMDETKGYSFVLDREFSNKYDQYRIYDMQVSIEKMLGMKVGDDVTSVTTVTCELSKENPWWYFGFGSKWEEVDCADTKANISSIARDREKPVTLRKKVKTERKSSSKPNN